MQTYRDVILQRILPKVGKPSRYLLEWNAIRKDPSGVKLKVALAFPDTYEIGMSHLGLKLLHQILNRREEILVERAYAPWEDFRALTLQEGIPLCSHESGLPLKAFDIVGFTLQYELSYTTVLDMLDLAGIPLKGEDRGERDPLVIAGGPCAFNPEPLVDFIDLFVIGDAEEAIHEIADTVIAWKEASGKRHQLLEALARIEGCYVPAVWDGKTTIRKRTAMNWADVDYAAFPMPYLAVVQDRPSIEVMRGCLRSCRFCQAGYIYRPLRERSAEEIFRTALDAVRRTGYEELSLSSLSISDLSCLSDLLPPLVAELEREKVSLSLPSMRVEGITEGFVREVGRTRKGGGFTIAPEAGSTRLRDVINKGWITDEQIFNAVKIAARGGWDSVKMYFMIGHPTEELADLDALAALCAEALQIGRREGSGNFSVTASASCFVPKPHTPFQWAGQDPLDLLKEKQRYLKRRLRQVGVGFKWHRAESSFLEAVFSRGDRKLGRVLFRAHALGCRFDGWAERLNFEMWLKAFEEEGIDPEGYATRPIPLEEPLPWEHIWVVDKRFLLREWQRALRAALTHECQTGPCRACGQVCLPSWRAWAEKTGALGRGFARGCQVPGVGREAGKVQASPGDLRPPTSGPGQRVRFAFQKVGELRFLSHLELMRTFSRAFRRARIPLAYSQGFHPQPRLSLALALPVGIEGLEELADVELSSGIPPEELVVRANGELPPGLHLVKAWEVPLNAPSLASQVVGAVYRLQVEGDGLAPAERERLLSEEACRQFLARPSIPVQVFRKGRTLEIDAKPYLLHLSPSRDGGMGWELALKVGREGSVRPQAVLARFLADGQDGPAESLLERLHVVRTTLLLAS